MKNIFKNLILMFIILSLSFSIVSAEEIMDGDGEVGSPDYAILHDGLSFWDKIRVSGLFGTQTVIDGAVCSVYPDATGVRTSSTGQICYTNTQHTGSAFLLYQVVDKTYFIGAKDLSKGEQGCFTVTPNVQYSYEIYYCDSTLTRTCTDTDGGKSVYIEGSVKATVGGKSTTVYDKCISTSELLEEFCVDDSVTSILQDCACQDGACIAPTNMDPAIFDPNEDGAFEYQYVNGQVVPISGSGSGTGSGSTEVIEPIAETDSGIETWQIIMLIVLAIGGIIIAFMAFGGKKR